MHDLEEIYIENYLSQNYMDRRTSIKPKTTISERIVKTQGLFSSLKIELQSLKTEFENMNSEDNGFVSTLETIDNALETPFAIFDSSFFQTRNKF
jgi:hypothetical protein